MSLSLATRIYRTIFAVSFLTIVLSLVIIEFIYEDMEYTILEFELSNEFDFYSRKINNPDFQTWQTANISVAFVGEKAPNPSQLPKHFQGIKAPASEEIEFKDQHFLVLAKQIDSPSGTLFISQDITAMEEREILFQLAMLGLVLLMTFIGFVLSRLGARKLVKPLQKLTHAIQKTTPGKSMQRLENDYVEHEYNNIANAFNRFLDAMEEFVQRENMFIKTASHELRTPIAILSGALDVIDKRQQLSAADKQTMRRIRQTVNHMQIEVNTLLALLRNEQPVKDSKISLSVLIQDAVEEIKNEMPMASERLNYVSSIYDQQIVLTNHSLMRMLLRNLLHNAIQHTQDEVRIQSGDCVIHVTDFGSGLPIDIHQRITNRSVGQQLLFQETRFGLLIAQMISEKLNMKLSVAQSDSGGTTFEIHFTPSI
ncbi:ATP-binding protein [Methylophaga nitratireducenticrescens]|uniref:histidine kinase n=1 Tax=Methylophaga nitratireducenticrescens TaxID=754476 RepID=I1XGN4_METNJ|nr:ATP-binding protein [Methylophaga nitratireducenticrescens]